MQKRLLNVAEYLLIAAMGVLFAFNYILFIVPNGFAPAGINGIAVMIQYKLNFSVAYMSLLINVPLCIAAYFYVDRTFAKKSLFFCYFFAFFRCFFALFSTSFEKGLNVFVFLYFSNFT